jgi:hypothetical protein
MTGAERDRLRDLVDRERRRRCGVDSAELFLRDQLELGPRKVEAIFAKGRRVGIGKTSLRRAADRLRLEGRGSATWALPGELTIRARSDGARRALRRCDGGEEVDTVLAPPRA